MDRSGSVQVETQSEDTSRRSATGAGGPWLHWAIGGLCVLVFAPTVVWLWERWTMSIWHNAHGLLVPFAVAYLIRDELLNDPSETLESSRLGFLFLILGLLCLTADSVVGTQLLAAFGMLSCLPGLSLLFLGVRRTKALVFPLLLAFFMLPIPAAAVEPVHLLLRNISAVGAEHIVSVIGIPVIRENTLLILSEGNVQIAEACSGFSTLYGAVTISLVLAYWSRSPRKRWGVVLAAVPLAIFFNVLRCAGLALLVHSQGLSVLETPIHVLSGIVSFGLAALALIWIGTD
jgi:exosortase